MREMKDSGIFDGVEIPKTWDTMKFGKVCSIVTDFVASGSFADLRENVPYLSEPDYAMLVRTTDLAKTARSEGKVYISKASYEFLSNSNLFGGEIVLPNIGSIGDVYVVPKLYERMSLAPNSIMFKTNYCDKYYYYYFLSKVGGLQLSEISQSTAMAKFNKTDLKQIRVFLPSLAEQQRIAEFLDRKCAEVDEMIGLQEQIIEELKAYKQSVITEAVTKGLNPDAPMRDSGIEWIGQIPEHWETAYLKRFCKVNSGREIGVELEQGDDNAVPVYGSGGVFKYTDKLQFNGEAVMFGRKGTLGKPIYVNGSFWAVDTMYYLTFGNTLEARYCFYQLTAFNWEPYITQTALPSIVATDIVNTSFAFPSIKEQQAIANYLDEKCADIDSVIQTKQEKIDSLKEYKKSIIYEYVTGKKEVNE